MKIDKVEHVTGWRRYTYGCEIRFLFYRCGIKWWHLEILNFISYDTDTKKHAFWRVIRAYRKTGNGLKQTGSQVAKDLMILLWPEWDRPDGYEEDKFPEPGE